MKKTEKLGFQLTIPLSFEMLAIQPDLIAWGVASWLNTFIVSLLLKFLGVLKVLLANDYQLSELGEWFFRGFWLKAEIENLFFLVRNARMIFAVELKKRVAGASIFVIAIGKLCYGKKTCPIILLEIDKGLEVGFYYNILPLSLAIYLRMKGGW